MGGAGCEAGRTVFVGVCVCKETEIPAFAGMTWCLLGRSALIPHSRHPGERRDPVSSAPVWGVRPTLVTGYWIPDQVRDDGGEVGRFGLRYRLSLG
jgi:hypothetical protein